ncbi:uncharacterized protein PHALS_11211 [Plasmopara halstedii]|uniref:Uncharacterized protein n=1 Tax=Plasmopara halstedii TaxID=4781 RepID=A0A0P1AJ12_PLAHL|nr:uncharacterized protein PHALS_11211 [Plasmopara halstedii]CEG41042.1 hypothetical protein PHALS_11211 [Plasmopara halstedii]|eukprot:XP_024577411.1 hypothetical protein PHALS_11211 [Plasmopara halstedii]
MTLATRQPQRSRLSWRLIEPCGQGSECLVRRTLLELTLDVCEDGGLRSGYIVTMAICV